MFLGSPLKRETSGDFSPQLWFAQQYCPEDYNFSSRHHSGSQRTRHEIFLSLLSAWICGCMLSLCVGSLVQPYHSLILGLQ